MKKTTWLLMILLFGSACSGQAGSNSSDTDTELSATTGDDNGVTITEIETSSAAASNALASYTQASFSSYIYINSTTQKILLDYNFFPEGTDFDSQAKTALIPCEYESDDENVSASVSAPVEETPCESEILMDLNEATFSFLGVEFSSVSDITAFEEQFEFRINTDGFVDALDSSAIEVSDPQDGNLENVYDQVMDRRL